MKINNATCKYFDEHPTKSKANLLRIEQPTLHTLPNKSGGRRLTSECASKTSSDGNLLPPSDVVQP